MYGHSANSMLLGLLREGLVTQLSHAGYLGEQLAKAETALRLCLRYDQDRPLRPSETPGAPTPTDASRPTASPTPAPDPTATPSSAAPAGMPPLSQIAPPLTWAKLQATAPGTQVDVVLAVTDVPAPDLLAGMLLETDEAELFSLYRRTSHQLRVRWTPSTTVAMGGVDDLQVGALVRARSELAPGPLVEAQRLVILTRVARVSSE
jgi:hypothetical protein